MKGEGGKRGEMGVGGVVHPIPKPLDPPLTMDN